MTACGGDDATTDNPGIDAGSNDDATTGRAETGTSPIGNSDSGAPGTDANAGGNDAQVATDGGGCGPCASGFSCSPSGICKSAAGVPQFGNVYLLVLENHSESTVLGSADAPYIKSLATANVLATSYKDSLVHPSLPNYVALTSGDTQGITCDCQPGTQASTCGGFCTLNASTCNCTQGTAVKNVVDDIEAKGKTWHSYGDGATGACDVQNHGTYAVRHVPFLYFDAVRNTASRCANVVPFTELAGDLGKHDFNFIAPDLCHDMHDSCAPLSNPIAQGNAWLQDNVHTITDDPSFKKNGVLFITWDEGETVILTTKDDPALIVISPFAKSPGTTAQAYDHYSLLATIQEGLGLPRLAKSAQATPIADIWK